MECKAIKFIDIGEHIQIIGEIMHIKVDEDCLNSKGLPNIELIQPILFDPTDSKYHAIGADVGQAFPAGKAFISK